MVNSIFSGDVNKDQGSVLTAAEVNRLSLYGDGTDGAYTSGDDLTPGKVYRFTELTLDSGDTLSATNNAPDAEPIVVKVQGDVNIDGEIDLKGVSVGREPRGIGINIDGDGFPFRDSSSIEFFGGNTVGNASSSAIGILGVNILGCQGFDGNVSQDFGGIPGGKGYDESKFLSAITGSFDLRGGTKGGKAFEGGDEGQSGGGGAGYGSDGSDGRDDNGDINSDSDGGLGGGAILIFCGGDFNFTGTIDVRGAKPNDADVTGGGGGGGMFWGIHSGSLTDNGTKLSSGGQGSTANSIIDGGDGGNGVIKFEGA